MVNAGSYVWGLEFCFWGVFWYLDCRYDWVDIGHRVTVDDSISPEHRVAASNNVITHPNLVKTRSFQRRAVHQPCVYHLPR